MPDSSILHVLETYFTKHELRYYALVQVHQPGSFDGQKHYLCIGLHALFFLPYDALQEDGGDPVVLKPKGGYKFGWLKKVVLDKDDPTMVEFVFEESIADPVENVSNTKVIQSSDRDSILTEVEIYWKTDYMTRFWRTKHMPRELGVVVGGGRGGAATSDDFIAPLKGNSKFPYNGYFCFLEKGVVAHLDGVGNPTGQYQFDDGRELRVIINNKDRIEGYQRDSRTELRVLAHQAARANVNMEDDYIIMKSRQIIKRWNLNGDLSSWGAWGVHLRTAACDIGIVAAQRKYHPPLGDVKQHFTLVYTGCDGKFNNDWFEETHKLFDTFTSENRVNYYDEVIIKIRMNNLAIEEDSMYWFQSQFGMQTSLGQKGKVFYKSIVKLLETEDSSVFNFSSREIENVAESRNNPQEIVAEMEQEAPGLDKNSPHVMWERWHEKVSRYLAYVADGGLQIGDVSLRDIVKVATYEKSTNKINQKTLLRMLDYFLYFHRKGSPWVDGPTSERLNINRPLNEYYFNERVMIRLLETNFILWAMKTGGSNEFFIQFLHKIMEYKEGSKDLHAACCYQVAALCKSNDNREMFVKHNTIPALLNYLKEDDDFVQLSAVRCLVNLSALCNRAKVKLVEEGLSKHLIRLFNSRSEELIKAAADLLKNVLFVKAEKDAKETARQYAADLKRLNAERIGKEGVVSALVQVLTKKEVQGEKGHSNALLRSVCSALWNLASHEMNREIIGREGAIEKLCYLLIHASSDTVSTKVAGALMALATNNEQNKKEIGDPIYKTIPTMVTIIAKSNNVELLRNVAGCCAILSSNASNLIQMHKENIRAALNSSHATDDPTFLDFAQQIHDRVDAVD